MFQHLYLADQQFINLHSILSIYSYFIHPFQNDQAQLIPYYRKRIFFSYFQMKKLEEFKQILGNEFDFQTENVDRNDVF